MPLSFWIELPSYLLAGVLALAMALTLLALGPRHTLNRLFALFALAETVSALAGFTVRLALWSRLGDAEFWNALRICAYCFMGPLLLIFAARYVARASAWADRAGVLGLVAFTGLSFPLFQGQLVSNVRFDAWNVVTFDIRPWGWALSGLPLLYFLGALWLFWRERRRTGEPYLALGVFVNIIGYIVGGLLRPPVPVMAVTTIGSVLIISYGILSRQLLNPMRELTTELERKVADRTAELSARTGALLHSEALAQARAAELEAILEAVPTPVLIARDPAVRLVTGNRAARALVHAGPGVENLALSAPAPARVPIRLERRGVALAPDEFPLRIALSGQTAENLEVDVVSEAGVAHTLVNVAPLRDGTGRIYGAISAYTDITGLKRAEEALLQSEAVAQARAAELEAILEAVPTPVLIARDPAARLVTGNRAAHALMHAGPGVENLALSAPAPGRVAFRLERHGIELTPDERPLQSALRGEMLENVEMDIVSEAGVAHVVANAVPLRDAAGRIYGAVMAAMDITGLKRAEEALRASEARLRTYVEQSPVAIFVANAESRYVEANPAACALSGYSRAELLQLTMFDMVPPEELKGVHARLQGGGAFSGELPLRRKDGSVISIIRNRVRLQGGELLSFCTDITARKEAEAEVQRLNADLEQRVVERTAELQRATEAAEAASRAKSSFLAVMGHELRTPLNSMFLAAEMLREKPLPFEGQKNYADVILASGRRLLQMVEGVLEFAAIDSQLHLVPVEVAGLLDDIATSFGPRAARKGQALSFEVAPNLPRVQGDVHRLDHIVRRLLDNALKFTPEGGRIAVTAACENGTLRLSVADTGRGLRPEDLERIFAPFVQLEASHLAHSEGAGLGLTLARRQAEAQGGRLWAESGGERQGSTFILELPVEG